ncbi:hypothetical protein JCM17960_33970 [Magnetospira thiophila]
MMFTDLTEEQLIEICAVTEPEPEPVQLLARINQAMPELQAHYMLTEDDWYRVGGVVDQQGKRVADDLMAWVEKESGGNLDQLLERHHASGYQATAIIGRTHYFGVPLGRKPLDFYQIEIEEVEEVIERPLFQDDYLPDSLEEVIDPLDAPHFNPKPYGPPRYQLGRLVIMLERIWDLTNDYSGDPRFRRFIEEWNMSSTARDSCFCNHWMIKERPYLSENGDHVTEVKILSPLAPLVYGLRGSQVAPGPELQATIQEINSRARSPMAWYYLMLTQNFLPYGTVSAIHDSLAEGKTDYGAVTQRDLRILENWLDDPYHA